MPVHPNMLLIEEKNWNSFDTDLRELSNKCNVPYFTLKNDCSKYRTIDGNHLYKDDGAVFTQNLCDSINTFNNELN